MIAVNRVHHDPALWNCEGCNTVLSEAIRIHMRGMIYLCETCTARLQAGLAKPRIKPGIVPIN